MLCTRARPRDLKLQDLMLWALSLNPCSLSTQLGDLGAIILSPRISGGDLCPMAGAGSVLSGAA